LSTTRVVPPYERGLPYEDERPLLDELEERLETDDVLGQLGGKGTVEREMPRQMAGGHRRRPHLRRPAPDPCGSVAGGRGVLRP
jgi:hypothetical protein